MPFAANNQMPFAANNQAAAQINDFDDLEVFALAHMEEPHELFEELAEILHLAAAHEEYMATL